MDLYIDSGHSVLVWVHSVCKDASKEKEFKLLEDWEQASQEAVADVTCLIMVAYLPSICCSFQSHLISASHNLLEVGRHTSSLKSLS